MTASRLLSLTAKGVDEDMWSSDFPDAELQVRKATRKGFELAVLLAKDTAASTVSVGFAEDYTCIVSRVVAHGVHTAR